jgi:hypothetical protein
LLCLDITVSAGTVTFATGTSPTLAISGSMSLLAGTLWNSTGGITFTATTTGKTITTNGVSISATVTFNGVGGGWTLGSALTTTTSLTVTAGTFSTSASNYSVSCSFFSSSNTNTRTITLNGSTITCSLNSTAAISLTTITNLTFNAGTSQINLSGGTAGIASGGLTFYNVSFTSTNRAITQITGANTFTNLSFTGRAGVGVCTILIGASQIINGALTLSAGASASCRHYLSSSIFTATRTITVNGSVSLTDVDIQDIVAAGTAGTWTGTRLGDCKGNTNITFPAAKTVYFRGTGSVDWGATGTGSWSATSGGVFDATQFPLAQDTAVFPAALYPASGATITINANYNIGTIDMSLRTANTMTLATSTNTLAIYGNWINGTQTTLSGTGTLTFAGRVTQQITSAGKTFTQTITIDSPGGTVQIQDAFTTGSAVTTTFNRGTLSLQSFTYSTGIFSSSGTVTRVIAFSTGNITLTGNAATIWNCGTLTNFSYTGTSDVQATYSGATGTRTIIHGSTGGTAANAVNVTVTAGSDTISFGASIITLNNLTYNNTFTGTGSLFVNIYGNLTLSTGGTIASSAVASPIFKSTSGTKTITTNGRTIDRPIQFDGVGGTWALQDALTVGSTSTSIFTLTNGTLDLNGQTLTTGSAATSGFITSTGTKNLTFNGGTLAIPSSGATAFNNVAPTGFTTTAGTGTGTITMTSASAKTFVGGGSTFNCTLNQGGAGALTITGANTFTNIANTTQPATVTFPSSVTNTFTSFSLSGTAGNLITINSSTAGTRATVSDASGTVSVSYCSIIDSAATGGATWNAFTSNGNVDAGNNTGWNFSGGGTVYNSSVTETATGTDEISAVPLYLSLISESATSTDFITVEASIFNAPVSETSTATDAVTTTLTLNADLSETANGTDSISAVPNYLSAVLEAATSTDTVDAPNSIYNPSIAETPTSSDATIGYVRFLSTIEETSTSTDLISSLRLVFVNVSETTSTSDATSAVQLFSAIISEIPTAQDIATVAPSIFNAPVVELVTGTDSPVGNATFPLAIVETISVSDSIFARFLWEPIPDEASTWTRVDDLNPGPWTASDNGSGVWQNVNGATQSWVDIDDPTQQVWTRISPWTE